MDGSLEKITELQCESISVCPAPLLYCGCTCKYAEIQYIMLQTAMHHNRAQDEPHQ